MAIVYYVVEAELDFSDQILSPFHCWTLSPIKERGNKNFHFLLLLLFQQNKCVCQ